MISLKSEIVRVTRFPARLCTFLYCRSFIF